MANVGKRERGRCDACAVLTCIPAAAAATAAASTRWLVPRLNVFATRAAIGSDGGDVRPSGNFLPTNNFFFAHAPRNFPSGTATAAEAVAARRRPLVGAYFGILFYFSARPSLIRILRLLANPL